MPRIQAQNRRRKVGNLATEAITPDGDAHRLVVRGGLSAALGYAVRLGARLLFLFLAARLFGAALFGAYSLAVAAVEMGVAVAGLGMKRLLFQLLEEKTGDRAAAHVVLDAALLVLAAGLALAGAAMLAVASLPGGLIASNTALALVALAPMIAGQALIDLFLAVSRWTQKMRHEIAARSLIEPYVGIAAAAAAYALGFEATGLLVSYWAGTIAALAHAVLAARACLGGFRLRCYTISAARLVPTLRASALPAATDLLGALLARLDLYLVGMLLGESSAGIYGMARQIRTPIRQVRQGFDFMLNPLFARTLAARDPIDAGSAAASASRLILAVQLPILITLIVVGELLLAWFGPDFAAAYWPLVILGAAETILAAFGVGEIILFYRRTALGLAVLVATIMVNLVAALFLVGPWGLEGAAFAVLAAVLAGTLLRRLLLRLGLGIAAPWGHAAGPIGAAGVALAAIAAAGPFLPQSSIWATAVSLAIGLACYAAALRLWLGLTGERLALENLRTQS